MKKFVAAVLFALVLTASAPSRERRDRHARLLSLRGPEVTLTFIKEPDPS